MTDETRIGRAPLWKAIADQLSSDIALRHYQPGDQLPTEAALATRFGVNRHTVRAALKALAEAGIIRSRRGAGSFVAARPTDYPLGRRVRFQQNLAASGRTASRRFTRIEVRPSDMREASELALKPGAAVHVIEGVSLSDGQPLAVFRSVLPAARLPDFGQHVQQTQSITAALAACGVADYTRAQTKITAIEADAMLALALHLREGAPLLRALSVNHDPDGTPIEFGTTWFAGERVTLTLATEDLAG